MKTLLLTFLFFLITFGFSQSGAPASPYYNGFDWTLTGEDLKLALSAKITTTHTNLLQYFEVKNAIAAMEKEPADNQNVLLVYGFSDDVCAYVNESNYGNSNNSSEHRKRHSNADQSSNAIECVWNREHTYPLGLGTPSMSTNFAGPGTDAHHVRAADVSRNSLRGNRIFTSGSGNSKTIGDYWYPGDEWKGDVARMMMYMYLRYPNQCKPVNVGTGPSVSSDNDMLQLFLQWNAEDPVSPYEDNRNIYLGNAQNFYGQGNRNPFIDNPHLATLIWGGPIAENRWPGVVSTMQFDWKTTISIYPNPSIDGTISIASSIDWSEILIYSLGGQLTRKIAKPNFELGELKISDLQSGFYLVKFVKEDLQVMEKLVVR
jgi:endonuclease I